MTEAQQQLISKKIDGELTPAEAVQFQQQMERDADFASEYTFQQGMIDALRTGHEQHLKQTFRATYDRVDGRHRRRKVVYYGVAAAISLLLLVAGTWFYLSTRPPTAPQLFATYHTPYRAAPLVRGESSGTASYDQAVRLYRTERYHEAIPRLEHLLTTDTTHRDKLLLLLGNSHLNEGDLPSAIVYFQQATVSADPVTQRFATWYLMLSYLKADNLPAARPLLEDIAGHPGMYQAKAKVILKDLPS